MTKSQKTEVKTLIRLGDSPRLAIKTVKAKKDNNSPIYQQAYYS